jgi:hypothetical protein
MLVGWATSPVVRAEPPPPASKAAAQCDCEVVKAPIEEVLEAVDDGYSSHAYIVLWHGARVLVSAPRADGHLHVGDELSFAVMKLKVAGQQLLNFFSYDPPDFAAIGRTVYSEQRLPSMASRGEQVTVSIQEVLHVEDAGYQQTSYVGQWHNTRVAIDCLLACTGHNVGESVPVFVTRLSVNGTKNLSFQAVPTGQLAAFVEADEAQPPKRTQAQAKLLTQATQEPGIIEEVLDSKLDGASYAAYIVQWNGARIALPVTSSPPAHHVGESLLLQVVRMKLPSPLDRAFLTFDTDGPGTSPPTGAADLSAAMNVSMSTETGVVDRVLSAEDDIYQYRAYVVSFHGARVIVQDVFGSTHYNPGDSISFSQGKVGTATSFMLLDFAGFMIRAAAPGTNQSMVH